VIEDANREVLVIEIDLSLSAVRVVRVLDRIAQICRYPERLRVDNGPELISVAVAGWAEKHGVIRDFIRPGRPTENSYIERFNRTYQHEVLNAYLFRSDDEVRKITADWIEEYNTERPHDSLGKLTPVEYREEIFMEESLL
jgi:putative transposase